MQLLLIFGIAFAVAAVVFALQNNVPVTVSLIFWSFQGSLAMVLLLATGLGALIAGLVSSPSVIRGQWTTARLRREVAALEADKATLAERVRTLEAQLAPPPPPAETAPAEPRPYVGLKTLLTSGDNSGSGGSA